MTEFLVEVQEYASHNNHNFNIFNTLSESKQYVVDNICRFVIDEQIELTGLGWSIYECDIDTHKVLSHYGNKFYINSIDIGGDLYNAIEKHRRHKNHNEYYNVMTEGIYDVYGLGGLIQTDVLLHKNSNIYNTRFELNRKLGFKDIFVKLMCYRTDTGEIVLFDDLSKLNDIPILNNNNKNNNNNNNKRLYVLMTNNIRNACKFMSN